MKRAAILCSLLAATGCTFELDEPLRGGECGSGTPSDVTLITTGNEWTYMDTGDYTGDFAARDFDDSSWKSGPSELGYGDDNEATKVGWGPNDNDRYPTTYFRHTFDLPSACVSALFLELQRDDGAAVYLNGTEVMRSNLPGGILTPQTRPVDFVSGSAEQVFHPMDVDPGLLVPGKNVVAAEVHQLEPDGTDISFDLRLTATVTD